METSQALEGAQYQLMQEHGARSVYRSIVSLNLPSLPDNLPYYH